ncbi:hypothetical protein [Streptomyces sp. NRRL F-5630]|uniref:hypothetical protein n=1 Tax=Streptomyces sp. NRRL F-5630 TaxID=1463864 RepID=UPI003EBFAE40
MHQFLSYTPRVTLRVDDRAALRLSPEGIPALPLISGPRLAVIGRISPRVRCADCADFQVAVTQYGPVACHCAAAQKDPRPPLPVRPQPHERDGRQPQPEPARPHALLAL